MKFLKRLDLGDRLEMVEFEAGDVKNKNSVKNCRVQNTFALSSIFNVSFKEISYP